MVSRASLISKKKNIRTRILKIIYENLTKNLPSGTEIRKKIIPDPGEKRTGSRVR
jgi:hypothetical protein